MPGKYSVIGNATNTASATVPLGNLGGGTGQRVRLAEVELGSDAAPADNAVQLAFQRASARGTQSTSITPQALDGADPAALSTFDTAWSGNPTLTANAFLPPIIGLNQRAPYRWVAMPGWEVIIPATSGAGLALMSRVNGGSAFNTNFNILFAE